MKRGSQSMELAVVRRLAIVRGECGRVVAREGEGLPEDEDDEGAVLSILILGRRKRTYTRTPAILYLVICDSCRSVDHW